MSGALSMMMGAAALPPATLSASWSGVSDDFGAPVGGNNEDRTITWDGAATRQFGCDYAGSNTLQYRLDAGAWTNYTTPFNVTSGQTLAWKYIAGSNESVTVMVRDHTRNADLEGFGVSASGW